MVFTALSGRHLRYSRKYKVALISCSKDVAVKKVVETTVVVVVKSKASVVQVAYAKDAQTSRITRKMTMIMMIVPQLARVTVVTITQMMISYQQRLLLILKLMVLYNTVLLLYTVYQ